MERIYSPIHMKQNDSSNSFYIILLFLISPIASVVVALKNHKESWACNVVWMFCVFYGYNFVIGNEGSDINRYKAKFQILLSQDLSFSDFIQRLFFSPDSELDFLQPLITYFVSLFASDYRIVLAVFGGLFGFFFSRNVWSVLKLVNKGFKWYVIFFIFIFSFIFAVWDINVMRFTIASHIFIYGLIRIIVDGKKSGWIILFLAAMMHFSFVIAICVFGIYKIVRNRIVLFYGLYFVSLFVSELNFEAVKSITSYLPKALTEKSDGYVNEDYKESRDEKKENKNFRGKFYQDSLKWGTAILLSAAFIKRKQWLQRDYRKDCLFAITLFSLGIFNILSNIPVMNRFLFVFYLLAMVFFVLQFQDYPNKTDHKAIWISTPLLLFYFVMKLRIGLEFTGFFTILGNPFSAYFNEGDIPFIQFFK
jgi:hypothetical protein